MKMKYMGRGVVDLTYGKDYNCEDYLPDDYRYLLVDDDGCYRSRPKSEFIPVETMSEELPAPPRFVKDIKAGDWLIAGDSDGSCHPDITIGQRYQVLGVSREGSFTSIRIEDKSGISDWGPSWFGYVDGEYVGTPQYRKEAGPAPAPPEQPAIRTFGTGATRNLDHNKIDYEGFLSPWALHAFGEYMHGKRVQADGNLRDSDNWQRGIPLDSYLKSMLRHLMDVWLIHRGGEPIQPETGKPVELVEALCALMFNVQGYLHETLKEEERE